MKTQLIVLAFLTTLAVRPQTAVEPAAAVPTPEPHNKGVIRAIRGGSTELSTDGGKTWKKAPTVNPLPEPSTPLPAGVITPPSYPVPLGQNSYQASFQQRLNAVVANPNFADVPETSVVFFEPMAQKNVDELTEDLQVLSLLLSVNLERATGDKQFEYKLGVAVRTPPAARSVRVSYLQDYGVNIRVNVPFPVAATPGEKPKDPESREESDWEKARRALRGGDFNPAESSTDAPAFNKELVDVLKKQMFAALRSAKNLRHVSPEDWVSITIVGNSAYSPRHSSVLAMRIKKRDADKSASPEDIASKAQVNAYFDPSAAENPASTRHARTPSSAIGR
jgi:hypothetical protein